jgi:membrane-anchored protein YejM (alkaline phosphatase superfamily)
MLNFLKESLNQQGFVKSMNVKLCTGPRQTFEYTIDYIKKFALQFAKERYFGFFWSSAISHDKINMPHIGDSILHNLLHELQSCGALERTVLVLMSDHGMRFGSFRETYQVYNNIRNYKNIYIKKKRRR